MRLRVSTVLVLIIALSAAAVVAKGQWFTTSRTPSPNPIQHMRLNSSAATPAGDVRTQPATTIATKTEEKTGQIDTPVASTTTSPPLGEASPDPSPSRVSDGPTASVWQSYSDASIGISLSYPDGWTVSPTNNGTELFIVNQQLSCGSCGVIPSDAVIITLRVANRPTDAAYGGLPFHVGVDGYKGDILTNLENGRLIKIVYQAQGTVWYLSGYFGSVADESNPLSTQFYKLVASIRHRAPPTFDAHSGGYTEIADWSGFNLPAGIDIDSLGNVYVADSGNNRIVKLDSSGNLLFQITTNWLGRNLWQPRDVSVMEAGGKGLVYVADTINKSIAVYGTNGRPAFGWHYLPNPNRDTYYPNGIVATDSGQIYSCGGDYCVIYDPSGREINQFSLRGDQDGLALDHQGNLFVASAWLNEVLQVSQTGQVLNQFPGFDAPHGVAIGPDGSIFVTDTGNNQVVKIGPSGEREAEWGSDGVLNQPRGIAVDSEGKVYVSSSDGRIVVFAPTG